MKGNVLVVGIGIALAILLVLLIGMYMFKRSSRPPQLLGTQPIPAAAPAAPGPRLDPEEAGAPAPTPALPEKHTLGESGE